jgi:hypothetical protein
MPHVTGSLEVAQAKLALRRTVLRMFQFMCRAIKHDDVPLAGKLLKAGMPADPQVVLGIPAHSLMVYALKHSLLIAKLLRAHNGRLAVLNEPEGVLGMPSTKMMRLVHQGLLPFDMEPLVPGAREWVLSAPMCGKEPVATYMHAAGINLRELPELHTSWPPEGVSLQDFPPNMQRAIRRFWDRAGRLRRLEARDLAPLYWRRVRSMVRTRPIALYWQQRVIERSCAPGGKQRAADLDAFVKDNALTGMTA